MINFGTSAYLKLLALNPKPRDSELRKRLKPSESGYDYHKAMRRIASQYATGEIGIGEVQAKLATIGRLPERNSAAGAINQLTRWLNRRTGNPTQETDKKYVSPRELFSVKFSPDFSLEIDGKPTLIHLWNTKQPALSSREAIGTLGLFASEYTESNIGVLCLRTSHLYVYSEATNAGELPHLLVRYVEKRILRMNEDAYEPTEIEHIRPQHV